MDVVVAGFGAAGACAAIEAATAGASVLVIDRFGSGGATAICGGVVHACGGTRQQHAAGITDTPRAMYEYLRHEVRDAVCDATSRRFCSAGPAMIQRGVPAGAAVLPAGRRLSGGRVVAEAAGAHAHAGWAGGGRTRRRPCSTLLS